MPQEFAQAFPSQQDEAQEESAVVANAAADEQIDLLDAVLDDIETTLEANAQEYVSSFVQKGGE
ncbi:ubiquitin-like protein Pup [Bifidobacterium phasiani]|uniref:Prokaryotic ubiquitin-like protein Pup n=1 Tax=Bifidobacterium phasiani TaxID=2834431 RepID=A0ABS6W7C6_9BIFI|nr:ubiquitin-like protein Pup [Bifidobacterium phasiani]MBW3082406.1 ubiquitin-like protein Pup [Bifidobacterium phasiani]